MMDPNPHQYYLEHGSFYIYDASGRIMNMCDQIAFAYDGSFGPFRTLLKHGSKEFITDWVDKARKAIGDDSHVIDVKMIVFQKDFNLDEINRCISNSGYLTSLLKKIEEKPGMLREAIVSNGEKPMSERTKAANVIAKARRLLLSEPGAWCKRSDAKDADGNNCNAISDNAVSWCMLGALLQADMEYFVHTNAAIRDVIGEPPSDFNDKDSTSLWDVVAVMCKAENRLRSR